MGGGRMALCAPVLVLNRMYMAVHVLSARRAFCLLCKGTAEVVNNEQGTFMAYDFEGWRRKSTLQAESRWEQAGEDWVCTVNFAIRVPRVIRLLTYDRVPCSTVKFNRRNIFLRDEHRCQYCRQRFRGKMLSLDHVVPRSCGGPTTWENIVSACLKCNVRKGGRTPREAGMSLLRQPVRPKNNPLLARKVVELEYESWSTFLT
ncbi:MAG: HNH endonuclease [Planctomycetaceae bacterium]